MYALPPVSDFEKIKLMWEIHPYCFWCGRETKLYERFRVSGGQRKPADFATKDHLFAKYDLRRNYYKANDIPSPKVLCCNECNGKRNNMRPEDFAIQMGFVFNFFSYEFIFQ